MSGKDHSSENSESYEETSSQEGYDGDLRKRVFDPTKSEHSGLQDYFSKVNQLVKKIKTSSINPQSIANGELKSHFKPHPLLTSTVSSLQRLNLKSKLKPKFLSNDSKFSHHITEKFKGKLFETIEECKVSAIKDSNLEEPVCSDDIENLVALIFDVRCVPQAHFVALMQANFDRFFDLFLTKLNSAKLTKSIAMWVFQLLSHFSLEHESNYSLTQFTSLFEALLNFKNRMTDCSKADEAEESLLDFLLVSCYLIEQKRSQIC